MENKIKVSIVGGSGYVGGELLRILLFHPNVHISQITSEKLNGKPVSKAHPNLRKITQLKFSSSDNLEDCDVLFLCLPHGESMKRIDFFKDKAKKIIDLSSDFRIKDEKIYKEFYEKDHENPSLLKDVVYGIPELHREEIKKSNFVACAGCNATATILASYPLFKNNLVEADKTVVEVKAGSSEVGNSPSAASHHPERSNSVRSFMPTGHRHTAEIVQELSLFSKEKISVHFSATAIDIVRGILVTSHVFLNKDVSEKEIWEIYRKEYGNEPFIRIVKDQDGIYRFPEPKLLVGSNFCDIGFEKAKDSNRLVVISAIDNLMKGAAGQAVQVFNIMNGLKENTGLEFPGLHPI